MPRIESNYRPISHGRAAHDAVSALAAEALRTREDIDWPVSGDLTAIGYGTIGNRQHARRVSVWQCPGVNRRNIRDVRVGDVITTPYGRGPVTRVGSVAGFYMVGGVETRWIREELERIEHA